MTTPTGKPRPPLVPGETRAYPVLPLRDIVVFPHMIVPLLVGREKSIRALEEVMRSDTFILLATQKNASDDDPAPDSIFETGTLASVLQLLKLPDEVAVYPTHGAGSFCAAPASSRRTTTIGRERRSQRVEHAGRLAAGRFAGGASQSHRFGRLLL